MWQEVERRLPHTLRVTLWGSRVRAWTEVPAPWQEVGALADPPGRVQAMSPPPRDLKKTSPLS